MSSDLLFHRGAATPPGFVDNWGGGVTAEITSVGAGTKITVGQTGDQGFSFQRRSDTGALGLAGGINTDSGAALTLNGGGSTGFPMGDFRFQVEGVPVLYHDEAAGALALDLGAGTKLRAAVFTNSIATLGRSGQSYSLNHAATNSFITFGGGTPADGGNILLYGSTSAAPGNSYFRSGTNIWLAWIEASGLGALYSGIGTKTAAFAWDADTTAGNTRIQIYDVDNGTAERVSVGAANSGGSGFKLLRIPN